MPATYTVRLSRLAGNQLHKIFDYIEKASPQNAARMITKLVETIDGVEVLPYQYAVVRGTEVVDARVRSMPVRPYLVRYHIDETNKTVTILSVRHGARHSESS